MRSVTPPYATFCGKLTTPTRSASGSYNRTIRKTPIASPRGTTGSGFFGYPSRRRAWPLLRALTGSCLYQGEQYVLQIDSHTRFRHEWDKELRRMMAEVGPRGCVSHYPQPWSPSTDERGKNREHTVPRNCGVKVRKGRSNTWLKRKHRVWARHTASPVASSACPVKRCETSRWIRIWTICSWEELLYAARLYTHGYDFYSPDTNLAFHWYGRNDQPRYWKDLRGYPPHPSPRSVTCTAFWAYTIISPTTGSTGWGEPARSRSTGTSSNSTPCDFRSTVTPAQNDDLPGNGLVL